jgi:hypothetical protein
MKKTRRYVNVLRQTGLPRIRKECADGALRNLDAIETIADTFARTCEQIQANGHLTEEGKRVALADAGKAAWRAAAEWHRPLADGVAGHKRAADEELSAAVGYVPPSDPARALEAALVRQEIRRSLEGATAPALDLAFRQGDALVRHALSEAPRIRMVNGVPMVGAWVTEDVRVDALRIAAKAAKPEAAALSRELEVLGDLYNETLATVRADIGDVAPEGLPEIEILGGGR